MRIPAFLYFFTPPNMKKDNVVTSIDSVRSTFYLYEPCLLTTLAFASTAVTTRTIKSEPITLHRIEVQAIKTATLYQPGDYTIPFQISIPGNISTTDCSLIKTFSLIWGYELVTVAAPSSLLGRRKVLRQPITFKRLLVPQSDLSDARYSAKRPNEIECSMFVPKFISTTDTKISARVFMHPLISASRVKSVVAMAIQQEKIQIKNNNISENVSFR